jgi:hypothetical protein
MITSAPNGGDREPRLAESDHIRLSSGSRLSVAPFTIKTLVLLNKTILDTDIDSYYMGLVRPHWHSA